MLIQEHLHFNYDPQYDVLYVDIGEPCFAYGEEILDDIYLRINSENEKPVGCTIVSYKTKQLGVLQKHIPLDIDWIYINSNIN